MFLPRTLAAMAGFLALGGSSFASPFPPGSIQLIDMTNLVVVAPAPPAVDYPPFTVSRGAGYDGVAVVAAWRTDLAPGYVSLCTGSNLGGGWILTAAHCVEDSSGQNVTTQFMARFFPDNSGSYTDFMIGNGFSVLSAVHADPLYSGSVISDHDLALVNMGVSSFGAGVDTYAIYTGSYTYNPFTFVGFGQTGSGATGAVAGTGGFGESDRHQGQNTFDGFYSAGVLLSDFDNGLAANDASCRIAGWCPAGTTLGLGGNEASTAHGDSGGPVFVAPGFIGAITAFGARSSADIDGVVNSSFGEFNGFVATAYEQDFILGTMAPEAGSCALLGMGLASLALLRRFRKR